VPAAARLTIQRWPSAVAWAEQLQAEGVGREEVLKGDDGAGATAWAIAGPSWPIVGQRQVVVQGCARLPAAAERGVHEVVCRRAQHVAQLVDLPAPGLLDSLAGDDQRDAAS
jgi:hypothetical protein